MRNGSETTPVSLSFALKRKNIWSETGLPYTGNVHRAAHTSLQNCIYQCQYHRWFDQTPQNHDSEGNETPQDLTPWSDTTGSDSEGLISHEIECGESDTFPTNEKNLRPRNLITWGVRSHGIWFPGIKTRGKDWCRGVLYTVENRLCGASHSRVTTSHRILRGL